MRIPTWCLASNAKVEEKNKLRSAVKRFMYDNVLGMCKAEKLMEERQAAAE